MLIESKVNIRKYLRVIFKSSLFFVNHVEVTVFGNKHTVINPYLDKSDNIPILH